MGDATLRSLSTLRANGDPETAAFPASGIDAFIELLAGAVTTPGRVILARTAGRPRALVYHEAYRVACETPAPRTVPQATGTLALEGVVALPLRHRAALLLACVLGFSEHEIAVVLGTAPAAAEALVEEAIGLLGGVTEAPAAERPASGDGAAA